MDEKEQMQLATLIVSREEAAAVRVALSTWLAGLEWSDETDDREAAGRKVFERLRERFPPERTQQ